MTSYAPHIEEARLEALQTRIENWALRARWHLSAGIERMGPCPLCGGKDRFSINTQKNKWNCRQCDKGGADLISLVMHTESLGFVAALERITSRKLNASSPETEAEKAARAQRIADAQAKSEAEKVRATRNAADFRHKAKLAGKAIWVEAQTSNWTSGNWVFDYLTARGIVVPDLLENTKGQLCGLRQSDDLAYFDKGSDGKSRRIYHGPAMVAGVQTANGSFGAVHQTWIDLHNAPGFKANLCSQWQLDKNDNPVSLPSKKVLGSKKGGAIRLYTPPNATRLVGGEGLETTLSVMANAFEPDTAYWCFVDLGNMAGRAARDAGGKIVHDLPDIADTDTFVPPEWVQELVYLGDADAKTEALFTKTKAALTRGCRRAMAHRPGLKATISMAERGKDFNDMVRV